MTNKTFIHKMVQQQPNAKRHHNSLVWENGTLYSYGYHYPLLINVKGQWILNDTGYSKTTAKHINIASQYADYRINIQRNKAPYRTEGELIIHALNELSELNDAILSIKRKDTKKEAMLRYRVEQVQATYNYLSKII